MVAAAAVLLTGVAATGALSSSGISATPNVIASQWAAAEQAGVEIAHADVQAAARMAPDAAQEGLEEYDSTVASASRHLSRMDDRGGEAGTQWSTFVVGVERAVATAGEDGSAAGQAYTQASGSARAATATTDQIATARADDLLSGGRSALTITVGTVATLALGGILVFLALRTRRILNIPLLLATMITAGLTYVSINPSAVPISADSQVESTVAYAGALQSVYQARQAQVAQAFSDGENWQGEAAAATEALDEVDDNEELLQEWAQVSAVAGEPAMVQSTQENFDRVEEELSAGLEDQLGRLGVEVSGPAILTSGGALLLGLGGAWLAWSGLSRRLQDYR